MTKRVLDVGNCDLDSTNIADVIRNQFAAEVHRAHTQADALTALQDESFDLVLVNRLLDRDGSEGIEIIKAIKEDPALAETPVMMITNYPDQQQMACRAGAVPGFGKAALHEPETLDRIKPFVSGA